MENLILDPLYIIKNYKEIDLSKDNKLLSFLIDKYLIFILTDHNGNNKVDLWKIKNNDDLFLEIEHPEEINEINTQNYTVTFRKNFDTNELVNESLHITKRYYIPSENWKLTTKIINKDIDKKIFSYLGYYI
jgi:hypothetical protein